MVGHKNFENSEIIGFAEQSLPADRKKPRPLKSDVPGGYAAWNLGADFVKLLVPALAPEQGA